jgi:cysteine desulfurase
MRLPIYLDYMATTPVDPRVATKMHDFLTIDGVFGNPASNHYYGYAAKTAIEHARTQVAQAINADPKGIIWTSGATEAINLALKGAVNFYKRQGKHIVTCKTEHKATIDTCKYLETQGFEVTYLDPEPDGLIDYQKLINSLRNDTILVSIMHINNEIGVIQDIAKISAIIKNHGALFHVDAAQSIGKVPIDSNIMNADLISLCAHKVYGPKGVGALYVRQNPKLHLVAQLHGGEQEQSMRSGTLATHQIVGMGEAFAIANTEENSRILALRNKLWDGINHLEGIKLNGSFDKRVPHNLNVSFRNVDGELLLAALKDIAVSRASACTKAIFEPSHVLKALGISNELAASSIRFSLGRFTTEAEIDYAIHHICDIRNKLL